MPGTFQAVIEGTGEIAAYKRYLLLGSLKQDTLVKGQQRVFQSGLVHSKLMRSIKIFQQRVRKKVGNDFYDERGHRYNMHLEYTCISALCSLIGIADTSTAARSLSPTPSSDLNSKYSIEYETSVENRGRIKRFSARSAVESRIVPQLM